MFNELWFILNFMVEAFIKTWPYLLITIPIAVAVQMSGAAQHIQRAFNGRPTIAILMATLVGAFSPFCSCGVIPIVAALLIGGVPLAPVMAFWVASPSMDPEIFFLSVALLGWELAIWRVGATLVLSVAAGFITHWLMQGAWLGETVLRTTNVPPTYTLGQLLRRGRDAFRPTPQLATVGATPAHHTINLTEAWSPVAERSTKSSVAPTPTIELVESGSCCSPVATTTKIELTETSSCCAPVEPSCGCGAEATPSFRERLWRETWAATALVVKFMLLAFFLEALIMRYVPQTWIVSLLGAQNEWAIPFAAVVGIPVYTTNLTALPLIGGLLEQGMDPAAALAFFIAGPTTTLPAMAAVWGLTTQRVFGLYVAFSLLGAILLGYVYSGWLMF